MSELQDLVVRAELSKTIHRKETSVRKMLKAEGVLKTELKETREKREGLAAEVDSLISHLESLGGSVPEDNDEA